MTDVRQVIDDLQDRDLLGQVRGNSGDNAMFSCPFAENHGGKVYQKSPSFGIRMVDAPGRPAGAFNCFSCHEGGKNILDLWAKLTGQTVEEGKEEMSTAEIQIESLLKKVNEVGEKIDLTPHCLTDWPATVPVYLSPIASAYMKERGIPTEIQAMAGIEWCGESTMPPNKDKEKGSIRGERIIFPIFWNGGRVGYSSRAVGYETDMKYYRPIKNMQTILYDPGHVLLGSAERIFVVEGEIDCLACLREGLPTVSSFGSGLTRAQAKILQRFRDVIFLYDLDKAGIRGVARVKEMFGGMLHWRAFWLPSGQDAASLSPGWGTGVLDLVDKPILDPAVSALTQALKRI